MLRNVLSASARISERALRRVLESADMKFRQLDMENPKAFPGRFVDVSVVNLDLVLGFSSFFGI